MSASAGRVLLLFKGEYDGSATYAPMDVVKYGVSSFVCKQESTGNLPTNTTYWQVLAQGISNISPEAIGIGYGISSDSGSARTATLADYNLTPNGIVAVTFGADVPANATLNINSQGAKPIYFRGSAIVANVIKGGDTVTFAYDGTHYDILCIDGGAGHKIINSAGTELTQRDGLQFTDGLEATDDAQGAKTKVGMNLPIVPRATWDAMTEQEKTAYIASHYRFGVELPDTSGVINAEYMTLLWENPNTTQAFTPQTITLNSADYDFLLVIVYYSTSGGQSTSTITEKGKNIALSINTNVVDYRTLTRVNDTTFSATDAGRWNGSSVTVNNNVCIPVAIYGIKKDFQFKVNAIADTLSTRADHCFLSDETTTVEDALGETDAGWTNLNNSLPFYYRKVNGIVFLIAEMRNVTLSTSQTIGTLPEGYRPAHRFAFRSAGASPTGNDGWFDVLTDGTVTLAMVSGGSGKYIDSIASFPAEN
jgi:hypothetical protein